MTDKTHAEHRKGSARRRGQGVHNAKRIHVKEHDLRGAVQSTHRKSPDIRSQESALRAHTSAQLTIMLSCSPSERQYDSQMRQAVAQTPHTEWCIGEPRSMNSAAVALRRAQSNSVV